MEKIFSQVRDRPLCGVEGRGRKEGRKKEGNLSSGKSKMNGGSARPSVLDAVWLDVYVLHTCGFAALSSDMERESTNKRKERSSNWRNISR